MCDNSFFCSHFLVLNFLYWDSHENICLQTSVPTNIALLMNKMRLNWMSYYGTLVVKPGVIETNSAKFLINNYLVILWWNSFMVRIHDSTHMQLSKYLWNNAVAFELRLTCDYKWTLGGLTPSPSEHDMTIFCVLYSKCVSRWKINGFWPLTSSKIVFEFWLYKLDQNTKQKKC